MEHFNMKLLVALTGTEGGISRAEKVREELVGKCVQRIGELPEEWHVPAAVILVRLANGHTEASWWWENRKSWKFEAEFDRELLEQVTSAGEKGRTLLGQVIREGKKDD